MIKVTNIVIKTSRNKKHKALTVNQISSTGVIVSTHGQIRQILKETVRTIQRYLFGIRRVMRVTRVVASEVENLIESVCYSTGIPVTWLVEVLVLMALAWPTDWDISC